MRTAGVFFLALLIPAFSVAAALVNINTADAALLDTLPGIGPTLAGRIIDYRAAHGPFAAISDIQNVSGIGPSTYANLAPLITVGAAAPSETSSAASSTESAPAAPSAGAPSYVPPPAALSLAISGEEDAYLDVPLFLSARATAKGGAVDPSAKIDWNFGDGSLGTGTEVEKVYRYPGTYLIVATASDGGTKARDELTVSVGPAMVRIAAVSGDGITLMNGSKGRLDLSGWKLFSDTGMFRIPDGTIMLPETSVLFPFAVMNVPVSFEPTLAYPDGTVAARYAAAQPSAVPAGSTLVQTVSETAVPAPADDISVSGTAHETTTSGLAPAAAIDLAAAGAALPEEAAPAAGGTSGLFHSPWTLGLLGVIALAGGAFILL